MRTRMQRFFVCQFFTSTGNIDETKRGRRSNTLIAWNRAKFTAFDANAWREEARWGEMRRDEENPWARIRSMESGAIGRQAGDGTDITGGKASRLVPPCTYISSHYEFRDTTDFLVTKTHYYYYSLSSFLLLLHDTFAKRFDETSTAWTPSFHRLAKFNSKRSPARVEWIISNQALKYFTLVLN